MEQAFCEWTSLLASYGPPLTGGDSSVTGTTSAPPPGNGATGPASDAGNPFFFIIIIVLVMFALLIPSMLSNRRERKRREQMLSAIKKHDRVQTIGGVIGSVVELKPNTVVLKVDESSNTRMTFARSAVQQVLTESPDKDTAGPTDENLASRNAN